MHEVPVLNTGYNKLEAIAYIDNIPGEGSRDKEISMPKVETTRCQWWKASKAVLSEDYKSMSRAIVGACWRNRRKAADM